MAVYKGEKPGQIGCKRLENCEEKNLNRDSRKLNLLKFF